MSLSNLASLGNFVGGIAVVVSFVFLALQIRQADKSQKALLVSQTTGLVNEWNLRLVEHDLADLMRRAFTGDGEFTDTEITQFTYAAMALLNTLEDMFIRNDLSLSDKGSVQAASDSLAAVFSSPMWRALWPLIQNSFSQTFRVRVDQIIREMPPLPPFDLAATVRTNLVLERARIRPSSAKAPA